MSVQTFFSLTSRFFVDMTFCLVVRLSQRCHGYIVGIGWKGHHLDNADWFLPPPKTMSAFYKYN
jgi:hypothetical protein